MAGELSVDAEQVEGMLAAIASLPAAMPTSSDPPTDDPYRSLEVDSGATLSRPHARRRR